MIEIEEIANGYYKFNLVWPAGAGVRVNLHLVDPDGDVDGMVFEWTAPSDMPILVALSEVVAAIDALPHWRVWTSGNEMSIGPADSDYTGTVTAEML